MANTKITSRVIADNSVGIDALNVTDGTNGQYLQTDGSGTLSFSTVSGYTDSDVETYLDGGTSTPILASFTVGSTYPLTSYDDAGLNLGITQDTPFASINNGGYNTSLFAPLANLTDGYSNAAFGTSVLTALTSGSNNTFFGNFSAQNITTASNNTGIGTYTLVANTADNNTAVGYYALQANTTGTQNNAFGSSSLTACTTGSYNVGVGQATLANLTTGSNNVAVGDNAMQFGTTEYENVAVGVNAGRNYTGRGAVSIGYQTAYSQTASSTVAIGEYAAYDLTTSDDSVFIGRLAGENVTTGYTNIIIGDRAGQSSLTTGYSNVMIGYKAGQSCGGFANTFVGSTAGQTSTGSYNTCIGNGANFASANNGGIIIGHGGSPGAAGTYATLAFGGNKSWISLGATGWSGSSDERLKENIRPSEAGLSFINDLKPVNFDWRKKKDIDPELKTHIKDSEERYEKDNAIGKIGFIAQDVKEALDNHPEVISHLWEEQEDGTQALTPNELIPMLVKAVQELSAKVEELQNG